MSPARSDCGRYLQALHLANPVTDWDVLARSQGQRVGDEIRLVVEPAVASDGSTGSTFVVNGLRHGLHEDPAVETLQRLTSGQCLLLVDQPDNPVDSNALLFSENTASRWVGSRARSSTMSAPCALREPQLVVDHVNGPEVPPHTGCWSR